MVVVVLEKCPQSLRGDLTKWLLEISPGVYVGQVSARVRDRLWSRVRECVKGGRATMVFSAQNEQRFDFRVHNTAWEPVDYDGLKLMLRPSADRLQALSPARKKFSNASQSRMLGKRATRRHPEEPSAYVCLDLETTGLDPTVDEIIEIGAVKFVNGREQGRFHAIVRGEKEVPRDVTQLTGLDTDAVLAGEDAAAVVDDLLAFLGSLPIVMHNAEFDLAFIDELLERCDLDELDNEVIDTLKLARKRLPHLHGYSLDGLAAYFNLGPRGKHRAIDDALLDRTVFLKLIDS